MKRVELDASLASIEAIYDRLTRDMPLPPHFGRNLDALYDTLTTDVTGPVEVIWRDHIAAQRRLGRVYDDVVRTLRDVARERSDFRLTLI